jgi:hypothetical protein
MDHKLPLLYFVGVESERGNVSLTEVTRLPEVPPKLPNKKDYLLINNIVNSVILQISLNQKISVQVKELSISVKENNVSYLPVLAAMVFTSKLC